MNSDQITLEPTTIEAIAVGICRTSQGNTHTGVAYRSNKGEVRFFHQAWHHITRDEPIEAAAHSMGGPFFCVIPPVEPERAHAICAFWEFIASLNQSIGYALRDDPEALFDENTGRLVMPNGIGLSCSTFVLVLFRSVRFPIIDTADWPANRPGDGEAQQGLVELLEHSCEDQEHVEQVKQQVGCERVRPEEISGACLYSSVPVRYPEAEDAGYFVNGGLSILGHLKTP